MSCTVGVSVSIFVVVVCIVDAHWAFTNILINKRYILMS